METSLLHSHTAQPLAAYGLHGPLFEFDTETIIYTWIALGFMTLFALLARYAIRQPHSVIGHTVLSLLKSFKNLVEQSINGFERRYYFFITSLFVFIFICNALVLIPGLEEPTKNLNTTFALAIISFLYVQRESIRHHGLLGYLQEYFKTPFSLRVARPITLWGILKFLLFLVLNICTAILAFPMELLSKLANVLSLSLRLFGNIFGSSIMIDMFRQATTGTQLLSFITTAASYNIVLGMITVPFLLALVGAISLILSIGFGILEGLVQAFVFSILTLTYIALAIQQSDEDHPAEKENK